MNLKQTLARLVNDAADTASGVTREARDSLSHRLPLAREALGRGKARMGKALRDAQRLAGSVAEKATATAHHAFDVWQRRSDDPEEMAVIDTDKKTRLLRLIDELKKNPHDRLRLLGDVGITAAGALAGGAAAGKLAAAVGAVSIPVITSAASSLGISAVAATPVGWVVGAGAAGAATAYGISRLIHDGGKNEARMEQLRQDYEKQVKEMETRERQALMTEVDKTQFIVSMRPLIEQNRLSADSALRLMAAVESGKMPISRACRHLAALAGERGDEGENGEADSTPGKQP
jgi:hypothetical protein